MTKFSTDEMLNIPEAFRVIPNAQIKSYYDKGHFTKRGVVIDSLRKVFNDVSVEGRGHNTIYILDNMKNEIVYDKRTTKQRNRIVDELWNNFRLLDYNNSLEINEPKTKDKWLNQMGIKFIYDNLAFLKEDIRRSYNKKEATYTPYYSNKTKIYDYSSPDFVSVMLCEKVIDCVDNEIKDINSTIWKQFRNIAENNGYKFEHSYYGETNAQDEKIWDTESLSFITKHFEPEIIHLTEKEKNKLDNFVNDNRTSSNKYTFYSSTEYKDFISESFNLKKAWRVYCLTETPKNNDSNASMEFKNLVVPYCEYIYRTFINRELSINKSDKNKVIPYKYLYSYKLAQEINNNDQMYDLWNISQNLSFNNHDTDYSYDGVYYKLIKDRMLVPVGLYIIGLRFSEFHPNLSIYENSIRDFDQWIIEWSSQNDIIFNQCLHKYNSELFV